MLLERLRASGCITRENFNTVTPNTSMHETAHNIGSKICPISALAVERIRAGRDKRALRLAQRTRDPCRQGNVRERGPTTTARESPSTAAPAASFGAAGAAGEVDPHPQFF